MCSQARQYFHKDTVTHTEIWTAYEAKVGLAYNSKGRSTFFEEAKFSSMLEDENMPMLRQLCSYELGKPLPKVTAIL